MAKYAEVREKQKNVDKVKEKEEKFGRGIWVGFTFKAKDGGLVGGGGRMDETVEEDEEQLVTLF